MGMIIVLQIVVKHIKTDVTKSLRSTESNLSTHGTFLQFFVLYMAGICVYNQRDSNMIQSLSSCGFPFAVCIWLCMKEEERDTLQVLN